MLTGRTIKATIVLNPAEVAGLDVPDSGKSFSINLTVGETRMHVPLNAKSARKVVAQVRNAGMNDKVSVILQGKLLLIGDTATLAEAGMAANVTVVHPTGGTKQVEAA